MLCSKVNATGKTIHDADDQQQREEEDESEPMYKVTKKQEAELREVLGAMQEICKEKFKGTPLCKRAKCLKEDSKNLVKVMEELHTKARHKVQKKSVLKRADSVLQQANVSEHTSDAYATLIRVERLVKKLRGILLEHVMQLAFSLKKQGVIVVPALTWDGSLGPAEEFVTGRLGFLLHACRNPMYSRLVSVFLHQYEGNRH